MEPKFSVVGGVPRFISKEAEEEFLKYAQEIADQGLGQTQSKQKGYKALGPDVKTPTKLASLMGVSKPQVERAQRYFRGTGDITAADYPLDTQRYVEKFVQKAQNPDGTFSSEKFKALSHLEKSKVKSNKETFQKYLEDPNTKIRAEELKKFVDDYRKLKADGKGYRMFLGNNFSKPWITAPAKDLEKRTVPKRSTLDTLTEVWKGGAYAKNPNTASALQMIDGYNSPKNKAYLKDLEEIRKNYLVATREGRDLSLKDRDGLAKKYMDDIYKKDLPEFYKSQEFRSADNIDEVLKAIRKRFSNPLLYPGSRQAEGAFDIFGKGTSTEYRSTALTDAGKRRLVGGFLKYQPTGVDAYTDVVANYLETPKGKEALGLLDEFVDLNKKFKKLNPQDVDSWEKYNKLASEVKELKTNSPKLDIFLKPLTRLGIIKVFDGSRRVPLEELAERRETTSTRPTMEALQKYYKDKGLANPIKPATVKFFLAKEYEKATQGKYVAAYEAGLNKVLKGTYFKTPAEYQNAVKKLSRVLALQLGGLGISGEHRVGMKMLDVLKDPDYVAKMVLSPQKFNTFKGQYIERELTPIMNNPAVSAAAKKTASERVHGKFFKDFGITPEMQKTYPKFEVVGTGKEAVLKETQVAKAVGKFGLGETMGDLKKTVKDVLVEQSLTEKVLRGRNQYKPLSEIAKTTGAMKWAQAPQFKKIGIQNIDKVQNILNVLNKEGPESSRVDKLISNLVEGEFEKTINAESMKSFGKTFSSELAKQDPSLVQRAFQKVAGKGGRLGMLLTGITGLGAVGLGAGALFGGSEAKAEEVFQEPGTTELEAQDIQIDQPASMMYNPTEGNFVNAEGEKEPQPGVLNWIAENPTKSSLMAMPLMMGAGFAFDKAGSKFGNESVARSGLKSAGRYLTGWKALIPAMMIPHAMYEYKAGHDLPEMVTNPINALWALGIRSPAQMEKVKEYYDDMKKVGRRGLDMTTLKGLKSVKGWKSLPKDFQTAMMSPAAKGTNLAFGETFRKPFVATMKALNPEFAGVATTKAAQSWGKKALLRAALIPAGILAATPAGWLTAGFLGADFLWDQYKDYRDGNVRIDEMRSRGSISEDEADNYRSLLLQGSIPFGVGNRMFGPDTMKIGGQDLDPTQQRELLKGMEAQLDKWQALDTSRRAKHREDDFTFSEGGRVGMKFGGDMDRRTFLKWLGALAAGATGIFKGKSKEIVKPLVKDATKAIPAKFIGVEGMPAWFPRAVAKIKAHGKLIQMADKHYVDGDIYEMVIPVTRKYLQRSKPGEGEVYVAKTEMEKVTMSDNPLTGEISMHWTGTDNFGDDAVRQINFKPGEAGYQKFGVDDPEAAAKGITEFRRVKVEEPEFTYSQPDQSNPYRDDVEYLDIFTEGDEIVGGLEKMTGTKQMVTKDGTVIDVSAEGKGVDEAFQKKIYKDIEGEEAIIPEPEGVGISKEGEVYGEEGYNEIIEGIIPDHLKKKASGGRVGFKQGGSWADWMSNHSDDMTFEEYLQMDIDKPIHPINKNTGGVVETGNIAREPGLVPPLSGPTPQGEGIVGLFSNPKQVNMRS